MVKQPISIAVDAMGGDYAPAEIVQGAVDAARKFGTQVLLVGPEEAVQSELKKHDTTGLRLEVVHASEVIEMGESPATALRKKRDASIIVTAKCVRQGRAQGMVAAGSTGAAMASALLNIGRIDGIDRPAIAVVLPTTSGEPCVLIDAGANAECIPEMLVQFARMGSAYLQCVYGIPQPTIGLLNIGEEMGKGNPLANSVFKLLEQDTALNFIGNVEGKEMFKGGVHVAVCDGFTGNVALKSAEGVMSMFKNSLKHEIQQSIPAQAGYVLMKSAFKSVAKKVDPEEHGGALLLGIKGLCVISHGGSHARGIMNAIRVAKEAVETGVVEKICEHIGEGYGVHHDNAAG